MNDAFEPLQANPPTAVKASQDGSSPSPPRIASSDPNIEIEKHKPYFEWESVSILGQAAFPAIVLACGLAATYLLTPMCTMGPSPRDAAHAQINGPLSQACQAYFIKNEKWPVSLDVLLERDPNGLVYFDNPDRLIDPWGNRYRYDPNGPMNRGLKPDIWTVTPRGQVIGNWSKLNANPR